MDSIEVKLELILEKLELLLTQKLERESIDIQWNDTRTVCNIHAYEQRFWFIYAPNEQHILSFGDGMFTRNPQEVKSIIQSCLGWIGIKGEPANLTHHHTDNVVSVWNAGLNRGV